MFDFQEFIKLIELRLKGPLPGIEAQLKMGNVRRLLREGKFIVPEDALKAAVLILFYPVDGKPSLVFIRRTEYEGVHSGQVSFPGGKTEESDQNLIETALRECYEEIGVIPSGITILGRLSDLYIPPSNFLVSPIIGFTRSRPSFRIDPAEVDHILEIPLIKLLDKEAIQNKDISIHGGTTWNVSCYYIDGNIIWGATAMILSEMLELIS